MLLNHDTTEVTLSNVGTVGEFKIRNSAKAFSILSSGLYSNKIRAIIRELSCNAVDSHMGAGKADVPFEVHLPSLLEPWFAVRDFGLGLDNNQVVNIYTTYFESTKTESNDFIGALGLGSKSPFSYTENFTVTAIKHGIKRIYSAFINESGVPSIAEMAEELTDEDNGVEVKFSVIDRADYNTFCNEARNVFEWFKLKPVVTGVVFEHSSAEYKEMNIIPGVHVRGKTGKCIALMGNIAYPLDNIPEAEKHFGDLRRLLNCGLVLEFGIGELDFAASREQLSYIPLTINSIRKKLETLNANLATHIAAKADAIIGEWEKALFLYTNSSTDLYKSAVIKYVNDTKFPLYDQSEYYGHKKFHYAVSDLAARGLTIHQFKYSAGRCSQVTASSKYINGNYIPTRGISVSSAVVIVLNDLKTGCQSRAQFHYASGNHGKDVLVTCVSHNSPDLAIRQAEYDKFIAELHNPPIIIKASTLATRARTERVDTTGITKLKLNQYGYSGHGKSYKWVECTEEIDNNKTYYYVCLSNFNPIDKNGEDFDMLGLKACMVESGIPDIANIEVYGVRKHRIKEIAKYNNWVWIEDKLKEEIAKVSDEHISSVIATDLLDTYNKRVYTDEWTATYVGPGSDYAKFVSFVNSIERHSGNIPVLIRLFSNYGNVLKVKEVEKKINDAKTAMDKKYPLLKYFKDSGHWDLSKRKEIAEYVKLIDREKL